MLRAALAEDLRVMWPAVRAAHLFAERESFERFWAEAPWRVPVDGGGRGAVVERWREHLDILWARCVWAGDRDLHRVLEELVALAGRQGFGRLLSPLVAREATPPYRRAGFETLERIVVYRMEAAAAAALSVAPPAGVRIRQATPADAVTIEAMDGAAFEPFWAYGHSRIARAMAEERVAVADIDGLVIGYTLCTVERGGGTLGRVAVASGHRGRGVGRALVADSLKAMAVSGAANVSLCTQEANARARQLYADTGMRELPGRLEFLIRAI